MRGAACFGVAAWLAVLALSSAPAAADTYCVTPASGCDPAHTKATITAAVSAATVNPGADTVQLGAATYSENDLVYTGTEPLTIAGAGPATTTIQHQGTYSEPVLQLNSSAAVNVSGLRIHVMPGESVNGIRARNSGGGTLANLVVDGGSALNAGHGIRFQYSNGWTLSGSTVDVTTQESCVSLLGSTGVRLEGDLLEGCLTGLVSEGASSFEALRTRISATWLGGDTSFGLIVRGGAGRVDDSLLAGSVDGAALVPASASASLILNHDTIVAGEMSTQGVRCSTFSGAGALTLSDSIVRGFQNDIVRRGQVGSPCDIQADFNDYDVSSVDESGSVSGSLTSTHVQDDVDPQFVDAAAGNYRLGAASLLLNLDARPLDLAESPTDLDGIPRIAGGARDLGAYERPAMSATTGAAADLTETGARLAGSVGAGGLPGTWRFVYGTSTAYGSTTAETPVTVSSVTATLTGLTPATTYHYKLVLTTPYGDLSGLDASFATRAAGGPIVGPGDVPGTPPPPPAKPLARLSLAGALRFKAVTVRMPVRCEATGARCRVTATVRHTEKFRHRKLTRVIATKSYALAAGRRDTMSIKLNRTGTKLLKRFHRLKARVTVELIQADGRRTRAFEKSILLRLRK